MKQLNKGAGRRMMKQLNKGCDSTTCITVSKLSKQQKKILLALQDPEILKLLEKDPDRIGRIWEGDKPYLILRKVVESVSVVDLDKLCAERTKASRKRTIKIYASVSRSIRQLVARGLVRWEQPRYGSRYPVIVRRSS